MIRRTYQMDGEPGSANPGGNAPRDLAGYPDEEKLVQGYRAASTEAQRQKARADALEQAMNAMSQRPEINPRGHSRPEDRLADLGIPVDALDEMVQRRINEGVQRAFEPIARGMTARTSVMAQYPDYQKYEQEVAKFISQDPAFQDKYNRMFTTDAETAIDYAFLKFGEHQRRAQTQKPSEGASTKRSDAQIPSARSGESRQRPEDGRDELAAAYKRYAESGDPRARDAFVKARLKSVFSEGFFDR